MTTPHPGRGEYREAPILFPEQEESSWTDKPLADTRNGARQLALQVQYWEASSPGDAEKALADLGSRRGIAGGNLDFAAALVRTSLSHREELDDLIAATATNWNRERLARLDALILRQAAAEIFHFDDIPEKVSIDEAVELAKAYGSERSYAFVNGVLDAIVRQLERET
ncbi:MAG: transcription antitermination factor NusB [Gemmatimonadetes bacterium]|nr:transcription antitermination factor NusB [Gemmatimonadota bacterium]